MQFPEYMASTFPGLILRPPLFYHWPSAIRFELNAEEKGRTYPETVRHRSNTLYESIFRPGDLAFLVSSVSYYTSLRHPSPRNGPSFFRTTRGNIFQLSRRHSLGIPGAAGRQRLIEIEDADHRLVTTLRYTRVSPRNIDYRFILRGLDETKYNPRRTRIDDRIYFINQTRNIIFHMYDDRGADVLAPTPDTLRELYTTHNDWILDYNRDRINQTFAPR